MSAILGPWNGVRRFVEDQIILPPPGGVPVVEQVGMRQFGRTKFVR
jgi:hypothetical protein